MSYFRAFAFLVLHHSERLGWSALIRRDWRHILKLEQKLYLCNSTLLNTWKASHQSTFTSRSDAAEQRVICKCLAREVRLSAEKLSLRACSTISQKGRPFRMGSINRRARKFTSNELGMSQNQNIFDASSVFSGVMTVSRRNSVCVETG